MSKTHIPDTTLFSMCWGEEYFKSTLKSIVSSLKYVSFDKIVLIADECDKSLEQYKSLIHAYGIKIVNRRLKLNINQDADEDRFRFSEIFLKLLNEFCDQQFIFTIQPDSCIICPQRWSKEFLDYDYIGAPWPIEILRSIDMASDKITNIHNFVGNGGFSIRSKKYVQISLGMPQLHKNEDLNLCVFNYDSMISEGIRFAPLEVASKFSVEHPIINHKIFDRRFLLTYNSFGFHGEFNIDGMKYIYNNSKEIV